MCSIAMSSIVVFRSSESAMPNDAKIGEENRVGEIHTMHAFGLEHSLTCTVDLLTQDVLKKLANVPKADYNNTVIACFCI